jgi:hypothetical protein
MLPVRTDDPDFIDRLRARNAEFRALLESRRSEADEGNISSIESVRDGLKEADGRNEQLKREA